MKYTLVNPNYMENYVDNLIEYRGGNLNAMKMCSLEDGLEPPEHLDNIEQGAALFLNSITKENSKICIIVDCDVDGFTSSTILYKYTRFLKPDLNIDFFVHSGKQHGLEDMMEKLIGTDYDLVCLPDAGSNEENYHQELKDIGIPVLVLDHHEAICYSNSAIVINNQLSQNYLNKELTGAGVVYQFCRYLDKKLNLNKANDFIDLAALGIISDMGSVLTIENYTIIKTGLNYRYKNYFFQTLIEKQAFSLGDIYDLNPIGISFYITPLINALIRVGSIEEKENLFNAFIDGRQIVPSTKRGEKGMTEELVTQVVRNCVNAHSRQKRIKDKAVENIGIRIFNQNLADNKILVIQLDDDEDDFPSELNGLIAMQLAAKYKRPTLVLRENDEGFMRGSIRGLNNSELTSLKDYLESTGMFEYCLGHANAAGASIKKSYIDKFIEKANIDLANYNFNDDSYEVNFERYPYSKDLDSLIYNISKYKNFFGQNNPEPLIAIKDIHLTKKDIILMGSNKDTLKFEKQGVSFIKFKASNMIEELEDLEEINIELVGKANINYWGGHETPQIFIEDYNIKDGTFDF